MWVCTTDDSCPTIEGWHKKSEWGVDDCSDCKGEGPSQLLESVIDEYMFRLFEVYYKWMEQQLIKFPIKPFEDFIEFRKKYKK